MRCWLAVQALAAVVLTIASPAWAEGNQKSLRMPSGWVLQVMDGRDLYIRLDENGTCRFTVYPLTQVFQWDKWQGSVIAEYREQLSRIGTIKVEKPLQDLGFAPGVAKLFGLETGGTTGIAMLILAKGGGKAARRYALNCDNPELFTASLPTIAEAVTTNPP